MNHEIAILMAAGKDACLHEGHEQLLWDEIVDQQLANVNPGIYPVRQDPLVEIDSIADR